jgi:hypothetical protein
MMEWWNVGKRKTLGILEYWNDGPRKNGMME